MSAAGSTRSCPPWTLMCIATTSRASTTTRTPTSPARPRWTRSRPRPTGPTRRPVWWVASRRPWPRRATSSRPGSATAPRTRCWATRRRCCRSARTSCRRTRPTARRARGASTRRRRRRRRPWSHPRPRNWCGRWRRLSRATTALRGCCCRRARTRPTWAPATAGLYGLATTSIRPSKWRRSRCARTRPSPWSSGSGSSSRSRARWPCPNYPSTTSPSTSTSTAPATTARRPSPTPTRRPTTRTSRGCWCLWPSTRARRACRT
mmetsp:Transcript_13570/g.46589  ORF Transcript_13570/g.46589 Transcript_13570/m.46589 type:complete len:263 (-) Transcript_13570:3711-4499(-)